MHEAVPVGRPPARLFNEQSSDGRDQLPPRARSAIALIAKTNFANVVPTKKPHQTTLRATAKIMKVQ